MSIQEEITKLEKQLEITAGLKERAEIILTLLNKHASINSKGCMHYIELLMHISEKLKQPVYQAWGYYFKCYLDRLEDNYDVALENGMKALSLFSISKHQNGIADAYNQIGAIYWKQGNGPEALANFQASMKIREATGDTRGMAVSYSNMGLIYKNEGNYPEALLNYLAALKIDEENKNRGGVGRTYNHIGNVYDRLGNYAKALINYKACLEIAEELGDIKITSEAHNNIGNIYLIRNDYINALGSYKVSLKIRQEIGDQGGIATTYANIGLVYEKLGDYSESLRYFELALEIFNQIGHKEFIAKLNITIGRCYGMRKEYELASEYLAEGTKIAKAIAIKDTMREALRAWYELKKAEGNGLAALGYYEQFVAIEKELQNEETGKKIASMQFGYQMEKKEQEVIFERRKKEELQLAYDLLGKEKERSEALLLNILPAEVAAELKEKGSANAKLFDNVTVLYTDFVSFTKVSELLEPQQLVDELHACFSAFDEIMGKYNIEKIKTVGDAYLAVSGLPLACTDHAHDIVNATVELRKFMLSRKKELGDKTFEIRIGVNSGSVVAGIVGVKKFAYDIWGDTVNTAARMEQNSEAGKINISQSTYELVKDKFNCEYRGEIEAKNKGKLKMYFVD
jgi:adenylate cyclase